MGAEVLHLLPLPNNLFLTQPQHTVQRCRDEQSTEHAHQNTHKEREGKILQGARTKHKRTNEQDGPDGEHTHDRGVNGTHQGLVNRQVRFLREGRILTVHNVLGVLTDLIENHHGVVQRVAQDRQETNNRARGDFEAQRRVNTHGDHHGKEQARNGGDRHLPGAEVERHANQCENHERHQTPQRLPGHISTPGGTHIG